MLSTKFKFTDLNGQLQEGEITVTDYAAAAADSLSLTQYLNRKYPTDSAKHGGILQQAMASNGLLIRSDDGLGMQSTKLSEVFNGTRIQAGAITAPDGTANTTPAGRIFFPEVILQTIAAALLENKGDFFQGYESLIGGTETVNAPEFKRARIDVTAPEGSESMSTAQLAEPPVMVSITAADTTTAIPAKAIGLMVSDQALASTSFDLVNVVMGRQAYGERVRMVTAQLSDVINGNADLGMSALPTFQSSTLDSTAVSAVTFSQKAWVHYLRDNYEKMTVTNIICTIDTALALENRVNKPTNQNEDPRSSRIDTLFNIDNLGLTPPRVFLVDSSVVAEEMVVGLDSAWALRRYINVSANYEAIESFVLRRAKGFRVDHGEVLTRLFDDAFTVMDIVD